MNRKNLIIIEDDELLARQLKEIFEISDYSVLVYHSAEDFLFSKTEIPRPAIYLIDLNLPGLSGVELVKVIRQRFKFSTIFVITGESPMEAFKSCLSAGADDFLSKPYHPDHLLLKVQNAQKKLELLKGSVMDFGVKMVRESRLIAQDGVKIKLTNREYVIMEKLLLFPDEVVSRETLLRAMSDEEVTERTIDVHVSSLRRKIARLNLEIETCRGKGYKIGGLQMSAVAL
jgi:two-component system response regulator PhoP